VSNQNLPGPYWQDQDDAAYPRNGDRNGRSHRASPWDDGGFWRDDERGTDRGQRGRQAGGSRHSAGNGGRQGNGQRSGQRAGSRMSRVRGYVTEGGGWPALFSQTADDLRKRFGARGSSANGGNGRAGGRADEDFWETPTRGRAAGGRGSNGTGAAGRGQRANGQSQNGYRGARRATNGAAGYGDYRNGDHRNGDPRNGDPRNGDPRNGRTAVREQPDFWTGDDQGSTAGLRARIAERTRLAGGGRGGGRGYGRGGRDDGRGRRGGFKNWLLYGSWWRHWTVKKVLAVLGCAIAAFILLCIGIFFLLYSATPIPTAVAESADWQSSNVYLANGQLLGTFSNEGQVRQLLTENQIPAVMTEAMTAAEDRNFYHEGGISITGLARAAFDDIFGHGSLQGGSTITMQYAKNYYAGVDQGQNITTKMKEIFIAMKLAHERSKPWVMTNYLNTVPFGATPQGLGAAAEYYFGVNLTKPGATLTVSQAAMLAAMPNAPGFFDPDPHAGAAYTALVARWNYVLGNMVRDGNITQQVASEQKFPKIVPANTVGPTGYKGYLWEMVQQELEAPRAYGGYGLTPHQLETGGYKITTTFSMGKVYALANSVNWGKGQVAAIDGTPFPGYDWIGSVLENVKTGAIVAIDGGPGWGVKHCDDVNVSCYDNRAEFPEEVGSSSKPYVLATAVSQLMNVFTSKLNGYEPLAIPYAPAGSSQATISATEQMPSRLSAPPGQNLDTDNATFNWNNTWYKVFNEQGENYGPLAVNAATALSSDAAYEDLAHRVGIDNIIQMAAEFGVGQNPFNQDCPTGGTLQQMKACSDLTGTHGLYALFSTNPKLCNLSLNFCGSPQITYGAAPLTPVEQASTFATLADDGVYHSPHVISQVEQGSTVLRTDVKTRVVLNPAVAADVDYALSFDNNYPGATAEGSVSFRRGGIIAKTGTLGTGANANTAWFIGATPNQYALSVALYTQLAGGTSETLNNLPGTGGTQGEFGGAWPATIWNYFMTAEFGNQNWLPVSQVFPTTQVGFITWIQVKPKPPKKQCQFSFLHGLQSCLCLGGHHHQCANPNTNGNGNPNPTSSSCPPFSPVCGNTQPASTPAPSSTPNPTPDPTPDPSVSTGATTGQVADVVSSALTQVPRRGG
jgi:membrane peptidoglycan carboxypeptidase